MADTTAPETALQLPPASVDFNALNDALAAGASHDEARDKAIVTETLALSADEARDQALNSEKVGPALATLTKAGLIDAAEQEFVAHALDADGNVIPFAEATNAKMVEAILAKRNGAPILPVEPPVDAD